MHFWHTSEMKNVFERNFSPVKFGHVSMRPIFELMTCCAIVHWVDILSERNGILLPKLFWPTVRKNCSSDRENILQFDVEGREFAKKFEITKIIYSRSEQSEQFWKQNAFLTWSWRFLRSKSLEQLCFKLEKIIGI